MIIFLLSLVFLISCVGTVEDRNPPDTRSPDPAVEEFYYDGLVKLIPISDSRIEVYFRPLLVPEDEITFLIYVNDAEIPVEVSATSLFRNAENLYVYTLNKLNVDTVYRVRIEYRDNSTGRSSRNSDSLNAKTFLNYTADFAGVVDAKPAAGSFGLNQINVSWIPAKSTGGNLAKPYDPVGYEITYISASQGGLSNLDQGQQVIIPGGSIDSLGISRATNNSYTLSGLISGETYYIRVRAIHRNFINHDNASNPSYRREKNNRYAVATTLSNQSELFFAGDFTASTPFGSNALTQILYEWDAASGGFDHYRIYHISLQEEADLDLDASLEDAQAIDDLLLYDGSGLDMVSIMDDNEDFIMVEPGKVSVVGTGLESFHYYQAKIFACQNAACTVRQGSSDPILFRVLPDLAPFSGILSIDNPVSVDSIDEINLNFDPPATDVGYLSRMDAYCITEVSGEKRYFPLSFNEALEESEVAFVSTSQSDAYSLATRSTDHCQGLYRLAPDPTQNWSQFDSLPIKGTEIGTRYCFAMLPRIYFPSANIDIVNHATSVERCITPSLEPPTLEEFPGVLNPTECTSKVTEDSITLNWNEPSGGAYTYYEVFWKENDGLPFSFSDASNPNPPADTPYNSVDEIQDTEFIITNLESEERFMFAVLTYFDSDGVRYYSEFNTNIGNCALKVPVATFDEWIDIFAVGPKEDGRIPAWENTSKYITESLDEDGLPFEVEDQLPPENIFNGVHDNVGESVRPHSRSGIVRIAWKDVTLSTGERLSDLVDNRVDKNARVTGYRVYRSDDAMATWRDLTSSEHQLIPQNEGLLIPESYIERDRAHSDPDEFDAVFFTDYSTRFFESEGHINRARIYHYKIVPVLNGRELYYTDRGTSSPQNIVKVTLPPPNMALVHRLMANRLTCKELGLDYIRDKNLHYTCSYNGLGARSLSTPWSNDQLVYDQGGDLLINRFELGCNFSRGQIDEDPSSFESEFDNETGLPETLPSFRGCKVTDPSSIVDVSPHGNRSFFGDSNAVIDSYRRVVRGDCMGSDNVSLFSMCDNANNRIRNLLYSFPGAFGSTNGQICDPTFDREEFFNFSHPNDPGDNENSYFNQVAHSPYASVYYNQDNLGSGSNPSSESRRRAPLIGSGSEALSISGSVASSCFINLPIEDSGPADQTPQPQVIPRWFSTRDLGLINHDLDRRDVFRASLEDLTDTGHPVGAIFYDNARVRVPAGLEASLMDNGLSLDMPLGKVMTSPAAHLPPITYVEQRTMDAVCSSYQVEVGVSSIGDDAFVSVEEPKRLHLPRRKEQISASMWGESVKGLSNNSNLNNSLVQHESGERTFDDQALSCNSRRRQEESRARGSVQNGSPLDYRSYQLSATNDRFYFSTGSRETQKCQSRYGVQDMVGNIAEFTSDYFFCDFSQDQLFIGSEPPSQGYDFDGAVEVNVTTMESFGNPGGHSDNVYFSGGCEEGDSCMQLYAVVRRGEESGACSPIYNFQGEPPNYLNGQFFENILDVFDIPNPNLIRSPKSFDQESISQMRSFGGRVLDFGNNGLGIRLGNHDGFAFRESSVRSPSKGVIDLSIISDPRKAQYFNPVLGITLDCPGNTCGNPGSGNRRISNEHINDRIRPGFTSEEFESSGIQIPYFPIGNSEIFSDGLSEISVVERYVTNDETSSANSFDFFTYIDGGNLYRFSEIFLDNGINPGRKAANDNDDDLEESALGFALNITTPPEGQIIKRARWVNRRNSRLLFTTGGSSWDRYTGRYSAHIRDNTIDNNRTVGGRCAILINQ